MTQEYKAMIGLNVYLEPQFRKDVVEKVYSISLYFQMTCDMNLLKLPKKK